MNKKIKSLAQGRYISGADSERFDGGGYRMSFRKPADVVDPELQQTAQAVRRIFDCLDEMVAKREARALTAEGPAPDESRH